MKTGITTIEGSLEVQHPTYGKLQKKKKKVVSQKIWKTCQERCGCVTKRNNAKCCVLQSFGVPGWSTSHLDKRTSVDVRWDRGEYHCTPLWQKTLCKSISQKTDNTAPLLEVRMCTKCTPCCEKRGLRSTLEVTMCNTCTPPWQEAH